MIIIIGFAIKFIVCVILLHAAMTSQELHFNPLGKLVASVTNPVYMNMLKMTKKRTDTLAPVFVAALAVFYGLTVSFLGGTGLVWGFFYAFDDVLRFILLFYVIAVLVGSTTNRFGSTTYSTFFLPHSTALGEAYKNIHKPSGKHSSSSGADCSFSFFFELWT
ncbi:MAG: hypothetical protein LRY51_18560, partial [Geovibrio sp.]|nr:hypothetical protein [Geovibrio sp.]